jgi:hypothetical protein
MAARPDFRPELRQPQQQRGASQARTSSSPALRAKEEGQRHDKRFPLGSAAFGDQHRIPATLFFRTTCNFQNLHGKTGTDGGPAKTRKPLLKFFFRTMSGWRQHCCW